ncbi:GPI transamidase component PIG-T [Chytriomyces sp. MP71]|nr:GPI transamidase component PIG-T [Chytriomyces sp. MP71]
MHRNNHQGSTDVDKRWTGLTNALAGTFCASLNFITPQVSAEPLISFNVSSVDPSLSSLRYSTLPREITCTENLTPWTKLLPCTTKAGIASLFNAYAIYDADYHSMSANVHIHRREAGLRQFLTDTKLFIPQKTDWSLKFLFDKEIAGLCPVAEDGTDILVTLPKKEGFSWEGVAQPERQGEFWKIPLKLGKPLNFGVRYSDPTPDRSANAKAAQPIQLHRHLTGYGRERGGITFRLTNTSPHPKTVTHLEVLPWFLKLYLHTLTHTTRSLMPDLPLPAVNHTLRYQPAIPRARPSVLELTLTLPPGSMTVYSIQFDRAFIKYTEHPPDANRGFDTGAAVLSVHANATAGEEGYRLYSDVLLIALPTPDFSMPYNVITMTCTVVALYFGTAFNLLVKRFEGLGEDQMKKKWWMFWIKEKK